LLHSSRFVPQTETWWLGAQRDDRQPHVRSTARLSSSRLASPWTGSAKHATTARDAAQGQAMCSANCRPRKRLGTTVRTNSQHGPGTKRVVSYRMDTQRSAIGQHSACLPVEHAEGSARLSPNTKLSLLHGLRTRDVLLPVAPLAVQLSRRPLQTRLSHPRRPRWPRPRRRRPHLPGPTSLSRCIASCGTARRQSPLFAARF